MVGSSESAGEESSAGDAARFVLVLRVAQEDEHLQVGDADISEAAVHERDRLEQGVRHVGRTGATISRASAPAKLTGEALRRPLGA